jgi:hypothetical protein
MTRDELQRHLSAGLAVMPGVGAAFLAGSLGRGEGDRWSDLDFAVVAAEDDHPGIRDAWWRMIEATTEIVHRFEVGGRVLSAVTSDWHRADLHLVTAEQPGQRSRGTVLMIVDRIGFQAGLPESLPPSRPDPARIKGIITEFLRVLGLSPVVAGREEWVVMVAGTGMLRDLFARLLVEESPLPDRGGALHLSRLLSDADMAMLTGLPCPPPEREALLTAQATIAHLFLPRARRLAGCTGLAWPEAFEAATRRRLAEELGIVLE